MFLIWSFWLLFRRLNGLVTHCLCWNATGCKIKIQWDIRCSFENCEKMLSRWKSQYVSRVDRLTLINECSMLSQPTCCLYSPFLLELFKDRIELEDLTSSKATRSKEISTLLSGKNWSRGKKKTAGIGVKNLKNHGKALMLKCLWRYSKEPRSLCGSVIKMKSEELDCWVTKEAKNPYGGLSEFGSLF